MYLLGIDFGGGSSKATLLSESGSIVATSSVEYKTSYPKDGYAEQNPDDWYKATRENIKALLEKSGINSGEILAISLDAATHTAVLLDENYNVLCPSIYWTDSRSIKQVAFLKEKYGELITAQVLHSVDTIWTLPQLLWIKENQTQVFKKTKKIMFAKDFVRFRLTDVYCTDFIEAQGSMFFDYTKMDWSKELLELIGFPISALPPLKKPTDIIGKITRSAALDTGLKEGTPVICGTTDTVMEVFASGAVSKGQMTVKLATAGRICVITDKPYPNKNIINYSHIADGLWYPGTATKAAASSYRWYRDTLGDDYKTLDKGAISTNCGADGLLYHPYLNGELTPYGDPKLRGSFTGIRSGHTKGHFSRAVMEGVAFSLKECKNVLDEIGMSYCSSATIIGGGASSPIWRQITADMLGFELEQKENSDSSFGSAMLAGVASGVFTSLDDALAKCTKVISVTKPIAENIKIYNDIFPRYKAVHDALAPIYSELY